MSATLRLGMLELRQRGFLVVGVALVVSIPLISSLLLFGYRAGLARKYQPTMAGWLVVQQAGTIGELWGSRLPASLADLLRQKGASQVIPEIHTAVGTRAEDAVVIRGVDLAAYSQVEEFRLVAGRLLQPDETQRVALVGAGLARHRELYPGGTLLLRGRQFVVVGIFETGAYPDDEAWIALPDAQELLGWPGEVSIFLIPLTQAFQDGDQVAPGVSVVHKGSSASQVLMEFQALLDLLALIAASLSLSAVVAMANVLGRLAWLRRREMAILQSLGFSRRSQAAYLLVQGLGITLLGFILGLAGAWAISMVNQTTIEGVTVQPAFEIRVLAIALAQAVGMALAGSALPVWWLSQQNLVQRLRAE